MSTATLTPTTTPVKWKITADWSTAPTVPDSTSTVTLKPLPLPKVPTRVAREQTVREAVAAITPVQAQWFISILTAAAERLRTKGWIRHSMGPTNGPNCAAGAIENSLIQLNLGGMWFERERLYSAVIVHGGVPVTIEVPTGVEVARNSVIYWNDNVARRNDVILAFEKTAAELKAVADREAVSA